jgi:hypothetical protein
LRTYMNEVIADVVLVAIAGTGLREEGARIFNKKRRKLGIKGPDRAVLVCRECFAGTRRYRVW